MIDVVFWLLVGHALADFSLQIDVMAKGKNRNNKTTPPPGAKYISCWPYWLSAHALIHGGMVFAATGVVWAGIAEVAAHFMTDFAKCENWITVHQDQFLHILAKAVYVMLIVAGVW
jgi:hypothetical protein